MAIIIAVLQTLSIKIHCTVPEEFAFRPERENFGLEKYLHRLELIYRDLKSTFIIFCSAKTTTVAF